VPLGLHHHTPQQLAIGLALHQQAADELRGDHLGGAAKKLWGSAGRVLVAIGVA